MDTVRDPTEDPQIYKPGDLEFAAYEKKLQREFSRPVPDMLEGLIVEGRLIGLPDQRYSEHVDGVLYHPELSLAPWINGKDFYDLGCGVPTYSTVARKIAKHAGARRYFGIDRYYLTSQTFGWTPETVKNVSQYDAPYWNDYPYMQKLGPLQQVEVDGSIENFWLRDDMLGFVAKMQPNAQSVFFLAGIEPKWDRVSQLYMPMLAQEIDRVSQGSGVVIITDPPDNRAFVAELQKRGFQEFEDGQESLKRKFYMIRIFTRFPAESADDRKE